VADTLDVLTLAEARLAISVPDGHTAEIEQLVTAVSRAIDDACGPVVNRTVTEYHDGGGAAIWPRQSPVSSVTTLKEWDGTTETTLTADSWGTVGNADGYLIEQSGSYAHDVRIYRRSGGMNYTFTAGRRSIELVYVAGRAADTASVDPKFKSAAAAILRDLWSRAAGAWARAEDPFVEGGLSVSLSNAVQKVVSGQIPSEKRPPGIA